MNNENDELKHYGILGMRWGHHKPKAPNSDDYNRYKELRNKKISQLSTKELYELNNRFQAEEMYRKNKNSKDPINKLIKGTLATAATVGALYKFKKDIKNIAQDKDFKKIGEKIFNKYKSIKHSDLDDDYLMHYGVLGMKWKNHMARKKVIKDLKKQAKRKKVLNSYYNSGWNKESAKNSLNDQANHNISQSLKRGAKGIGLVGAGYLGVKRRFKSGNRPGLNGGTIKLGKNKTFTFDNHFDEKVAGIAAGVIAAYTGGKVAKNLITKAKNNRLANEIYNEHVDKLAKGKYKPSSRSKNKDKYKGMYD